MMMNILLFYRQYHIEGLKEYYAKYNLLNLDQYNSSKESISKEAIKEILQKGGFI